MISASQYKFIADNLGLTHAEAVYTRDSLTDMNEVLSRSELPEINVEKQILAKAINDTYRIIANSHVNISVEMQQMVHALNRHVLHRYSTLDAFLSESGVKVSQEFADLALRCGYEISSANIE